MKNIASPYRHSRIPISTLDVFKRLPEGTRAQVIEDHLLMEPAPLFMHQDVLAIISFELYQFVNFHQLGKVVFAPVDVYLDKENVFQPDLVYISNRNSHIIKRKGLYGVPDLAVEILSDSTQKYDREIKKKVYERHGLKEYWLVNPDNRLAEGFQLINGAFRPLPSKTGLLQSRLLHTCIQFRES